MYFDSEYFLDEVREGFYVSGEIKRFWAAQLEVLNDIDEVCRRHGLRWYADYGTLLGAVRHGGFIPWDDDLDICMLREDYDRFAEIARRELPAHYRVMDSQSDDYFEKVIRVTNTIKIETDTVFLQKYHEFPYPAGIDIFGLDYLSNDSEAEKRRCEMAGLLLQTADSLEDTQPLSPEAGEVLDEIERLTDTRLDRNAPIKRQLYALYETYCRMFTGKPADYVAQMQFYLANGSHKYPRAYFTGNLLMDFETMKVPVPLYAIGKLRADYGDFMRLNRKGGMHDYPLFEENERKLIEYLQGQYPFCYRIRKDRMQNPWKEKRLQWAQIEDAAGKLLLQIQDTYEKLLAQGGEDDCQLALQLLESAQRAAMEAGEKLEAVQDADSVRQEVDWLEAYCEMVYQNYLMLSGAMEEKPDCNGAESANGIRQDKAAGMRRALQGFIACKEERLRNREIVFLLARAEHWKLLSPYYELLQNQGYPVSVLFVPYYMRNMAGELQEMHYEAGRCPGQVRQLAYSNVNLKKRQPWMIVTTCGHDMSGYTASVAPEYYTGELKKITEHLVYLSPYETGRLEAGDYKMRKSMEHYVSIPALANAEYTLVSSDEQRQSYLDYLQETVQDVADSEWRKRILTAQQFFRTLLWEDGKVETKDVCSRKEEAAEERSMVPTGKVLSFLFLYVSAGTICYYKEKAVRKIEEITKVMAACADKVLPIWFLPEYEQEYIRKAQPELMQKLEQLMANLKKQVPNARIWETDAQAAELCAAYYGDESPYVKWFRTKNKPVMIENMEVL